MQNLKAFNPVTSEELDGNFQANSLDDLSHAVASAKEAFAVYSKTNATDRAQFLEAMAEEILSLGDELIERASAESGLPIARITGERGRTVNQLRLFASHVEEGSWVEASIDTAIPGREPLPKPDIRKMLIPIGPVAVFTASNFPLAFSTAGGDTASALAAGNPVIVKGHNAHLGTNELVTRAIQNACKKQGLPNGVFTSLVGTDFTLGQELVKHPEIRAVGFTGSFSGGKALYDIAVRRDNPIPVYAEMSSINPTILLPNALSRHSETLATNLAGSITLGVGQFCTNPGLLIGIDSPELEAFANSLKDAIQQSAGSTMLHQGIHRNYEEKLENATNQPGVELLGESDQSGGGLTGKPVVATTTAEHFLSNPTLSEEIFGPYSLLVKCHDNSQLQQVLQAVEGQLTITFMAEEDEIEANRELVTIAENATGRVIFNGVPTGVEVCHSMIHGGPFPATTDARTTSVGTDAIKRFARPVCYQDVPTTLLPSELRNDNSQNIWRVVNGKFTKNAV